MYENITVNIWMTKGEHHFIQCVEELFEIQGTAADAPFICGHSLFQFFPNMRVAPKHDNVKYYIRPMECKLRYTTFKKIEDYGSEEAFWENCVDLERDAKPLIRLHRKASYFNITNFAHFENIRFTAVDSLAVTTEVRYADYW